MNIIITGASKGIGKAIAELLVKNQMNVALCSRSQTDLELVEKELLAINPNVEILIKVCDVSKKDEVVEFAQFVLEKWQVIDVLVNNAGTFLPGTMHEEQDEVLQIQMDTNLYSAYYLTKEILPRMKKQGKGHIFNMCSIASLAAYPNAGSYTISKFALLGFSKVLREELKDSGIRVTSILPGATWSNSWAGVELPLERLMQANDIAIAVKAAIDMSPSAVLEDIVIRPQAGDL